MPKASCAICHKSWSKEDIKLFHVPKNQQRRERWSEACGIQFHNSARICENHFWENDFTTSVAEYPKRRRLKPNVVPTLCLPNAGVATEQLWEDDTIADEDRPQDSLHQCEPHEIAVNKQLTVNRVAQRYQSRNDGEGDDDDDADADADAALSLPQKEPLQFINEKLFDLTNEDHSMNNMDSDSADIENLLTYNSHRSTPTNQVDINYDITMYRTIGVQTGTTNKHLCGLLEVSFDYQKYNVNCYYCMEQFPVWEWVEFINHIQKEHKISEDKFPKELDELYEEAESDLIISPLCVKAECDDMENLEPDPEGPDMKARDVNSPASNFIDELDSEGDTNQPAEIYEFLSNDEEMVDSLDENQGDSTEEDEIEYTNEIRFGETDGAIIQDFLKLFRSFPVLWPPVDTKCAPDYDAAVNKMTAQMNDKWNMNIAVRAMHKSLRRIKDWFYGVWSTHKVRESADRNGYRCNYVEYFKKCAEFLPAPNFRKNSSRPPLIAACNHCSTFFLSELSLQTHRYVEHSIGELPYKCQHCERSFETVDRLQRHEATHNRVRSYLCPTCNRGFYNDAALRVHLLTHDEDHKQVCEVCGKKFLTPSRYRIHKVIHEPPAFKCRICGHAYFRCSRLMEHMKAHRNQRDHVCDKCGKAFVRQKNLMEHKKTVHSKDKAYSCKICSMKFKAFSNLYVHKKRSHLVLEGTIQDLENKTGEGYTKHKYLVDDETKVKRIVCDICGNTYRYHAGLYAHKAKAHGYVSPSNQRRRAAKKKPPTSAPLVPMAPADNTDFIELDEDQIITEDISDEENEDAEPNNDDDGDDVDDDDDEDDINDDEEGVEGDEQTENGEEEEVAELEAAGEVDPKEADEADEAEESQEVEELMEEEELLKSDYDTLSSIITDNPDFVEQYL